MSNTLTVEDVLKVIKDRAQDCRENGDSDMRNILNTVAFLRKSIKEGQPREEFLNEWYEDGEKDDD